MNDIKYKFETEYGEFYLVENSKYDETMKYPVFVSKDLKDFGEVVLLNYPLPVLKTKNEEVITHLKKAWDEGYSDFLSDIVGKNNFSHMYKRGDDFYLILRNKDFQIQDTCNLAIFSKGVNEIDELGTMEITKKISSEILELDQNLQSCGSLDLILELLEENPDMKKYIEFIKKNIKESDMDDLFFFDEYIYELFSKKYMEVLNDVAPYKHDGFGIKGIERFVDRVLKNEYNDECKCCNV
ncbi:hypothetical protein IMK15_05040 [Sneathia sp. DSM 16631]|uniref:hypothetical protein n=1 Tax=Sneathia TaxID=168808 RepID=UPI001867B27D|nr:MULTISPECIES: hypothetical protein [Sneathia]MBE3031324.1 hypothetical protein [Sneathia sp. DSM 16631]MDK9581941.1 hypothetical protein [Sneathia vaginalis]